MLEVYLQSYSIIMTVMTTIQYRFTTEHTHITIILIMQYCVFTKQIYYETE